MKTSRWLCAALLTLAACVAPTRHLWLPTIGHIHYFPPATTLVMPAMVTAGLPFEITVTTGGSSDCTRVAGAEVDIEALTATVTPRDLFPSGDDACYRDLVGYPRTVRLQFDTPGTATVRVRGRDRNGAIMFVERTLTVEPAPN